MAATIYDVDVPDSVCPVLPGVELLGLEKLLKLAREDSAMLRTDLADIGRAYIEATQEFEKLDTVAKAPAKVKEGVSAVERERRYALQKTVLALSAAQEGARHRLDLADVEMRKLEQLLDLSSVSNRALNEIDALND